MFNKTILIGNLTKDIDLRYLQNGTAIGKSSIAVNRNYVLNGEKKSDVMFVDIVFFGRLAEVAKQYTSKGSKLLIEGRLVQESWRDTAGQNRSKHVISVENMEMLGGDGGHSINTQNNTNNNTYYKNGHDTEVDDKVADARNFANSVAKKAKESKELDRNLEILNEEYDRVNETIPF